MAYVESFARAMERARASVSYWDRKTLDHLQAAHDAEMRQCSKAEYHRGYEDGQAVTAADQWQLDRERKAVAERLQVVNPSELCGSHESLSAICKAIQEPVTGWTMSECQSLRDRLIALMGGDTDLAKTDAKMPDSGHVRECPQFPTATYDMLGNERHKVVCRLRKFEPWIGGKPTEEASKLIRCIIGREDCHVACGNDLEEARDRLIHLLGGDECNFSGAENDTGMQDDGANPAETSEWQGDHVSLDTPSSITDELRDWVRNYIWQYANKHMELIDIADRIDEQFNRICSQHEAVLQQTISDTVDEHEREMAELRADYERATKLQREYGGEVAELLDLIRDAAKDYQECHRLLRVFKCHVKDVRHERDDLLDKLQAISVLCEQADG